CSPPTRWPPSPVPAWTGSSCTWRARIPRRSTPTRASGSPRNALTCSTRGAEHGAAGAYRRSWPGSLSARARSGGSSGPDGVTMGFMSTQTGDESTPGTLTAEPGQSADQELPEGRFADRELSWLQFNERVLELAEDDGLPLLERVRFLAIFASNLDGVFMGGVAGLKRRIGTGVAGTAASGLLAPEALHDSEKERLHKYFRKMIFPVLTPLAVDPAHPFPYISGLSLNLAVIVRNPTTGKEHFARVKVPPLLPRFIAVDARGRPHRPE